VREKGVGDREKGCLRNRRELIHAALNRSSGDEKAQTEPVASVADKLKSALRSGIAVLSAGTPLPSS